VANCDKCGGDPYARRKDKKPTGLVTLHWVCQGCFGDLQPVTTEVEPFDFKALTYHMLIPLITVITLCIVAGLMII
jgi:hypothetical protein